MWRRVRRWPLWPAVGANLVTQGLLAAAQLLAVPAFVHAWGAAAYGRWLMLWTLPAALALADLGMATAGANRLAAEVARGERTAAARTLAALRRLVNRTALAMLALGAVVLVAWPGLDARAAGLLLVAYGAVGLGNGVAVAGLRAVGGYARAELGFAGGVAAELAAALLVLGLGGGPTAVAAAYLLVRCGTAAGLRLMLRRRAPWLADPTRPAPLRPLLRPGLAALAIPAAQAIGLSGATLVLGTVAGSAAVPALAIGRTLSRIAVQAVLLVAHAAMPVAAAAHGRGDAHAFRRLARLVTALALALALPGAAVLAAAGGPLVAWWTAGAIRPAPALMAWLAVGLVANALWQPASNLLLAANRHGAFSWFYLPAAAVGLLVAWPLDARAGATGAIAALALVDLAMVWRVALAFRRVG